MSPCPLFYKCSRSNHGKILLLSSSSSSCRREHSQIVMFVQYSGSTKLIFHSILLSWSFRDAASFVGRRKVVDGTSKWVSACFVPLSLLLMLLLTTIVLLIIYCLQRHVTAYYYLQYTTTSQNVSMPAF